jgi:hypothetical protein
VYQDPWKRQNKHYQRAAPKNSTVETAAMKAGKAPEKLVHPQPAHLPSFGGTVAIPTRSAEVHTNYIPTTKEKSPAATQSRASPVRSRRRVKKAPTTIICDDYAAQERLRRQMVMGLGAGCRGAQVKDKGNGAGKPRATTAPPSPRWKANSLRKTGPSALFDAHANAEMIGGDGNFHSTGARTNIRSISPSSARLPKAERPLPFKPGGTHAASRYAAIDALGPRAGAAPAADPATAGVAPSPHLAGGERVPGDRARIRNRQAHDGAFVPMHPARSSAFEQVSQCQHPRRVHRAEYAGLSRKRFELIAVAI